MAAPSPGALVSSGDELCREYLAWRGCSASLRAFDEERSADRGAGLSADRLTELIFGTHVAGHDAAALCGLLDFLQSRFYSRLGEEWAADTRKLESSVLRLFVVRALQAGRRDKVLEVRAGVYAVFLRSRAVPNAPRSSSTGKRRASWPWRTTGRCGVLKWMMRVSCCCLALTALGVAT
jgi:hypothetical protein